MSTIVSLSGVVPDTVALSVTVALDVFAALLVDTFDTNRAAGSVNGTAAEPGAGVRTVVDTQSKLSITGA